MRRVGEWKSDVESSPRRFYNDWGRTELRADRHVSGQWSPREVNPRIGADLMPVVPPVEVSIISHRPDSNVSLSPYRQGAEASLTSHSRAHSVQHVSDPTQASRFLQEAIQDVRALRHGGGTDEPIPTAVIVAFDTYVVRGTTMLKFVLGGPPHKRFFSLRVLDRQSGGQPHIVFGWCRSSSSKRIRRFFPLADLVEVCVGPEGHENVRCRQVQPGVLKGANSGCRSTYITDDNILHFRFQSSTSMAEETVSVQAPDATIFLAWRVVGDYFSRLCRSRRYLLILCVPHMMEGWHVAGDHTPYVTQQYRRFLEYLRNICSIPPFSESMAGVVILFVFINSVSTSIWMFNAWSPFIFKLFGNSNLHVGLMSAVNGVFELFFAMVSGHLADKVYGPSRTLRFAVHFGLVNLMVALLGIWLESVWVLILVQCLEGTYMGFSITCLESVFAQCLRRGERDHMYSVKFSCEAAGPIAGLLVSAILYSFVGNEWNVDILRWVMTVGILMHCGSMVTFLYLFKPLPSRMERAKAKRETLAATTHTNGMGADGDGGYKVERMECQREEEEPRVDVDGEDELPPSSSVLATSTELVGCARTAILQGNSGALIPLHQREPSTYTSYEYDTPDCPRNTTFSSLAVEVASAGAGRDASNELGSYHGPGEIFIADQRAAGEEDGVEVPPNARVRYIDVEADRVTGCKRRVLKCIPIHYYPAFVVMTDLVIIMGSGMTTQYFTLFMMTVYDVSPVLMAILNLLNSCLIAVLAIVIGVVGKRVGRVRVMLPPRIIGSLILLWMALSRGTSHAPKWLMCIAYVVRNALMNCQSGASRALIMDLVSEHQRGRWNALESVQSAGWSGTAVLGGYLADSWGYGAAFIITFCFHFTACGILAPLAIRNDTRLPRVEYVVDGVVVSADGQYHPKPLDETMYAKGCLSDAEVMTVAPLIEANPNITILKGSDDSRTIECADHG